MRFRDKAAPYLAMGWPVFPTVRGSKTFFPKRHPDEMAGFYWATTDQAQIDAWDEQWPDANIALRTGAESNVVVIDLDFGKGDRARQTLDRLAEKGRLFPEPLGKARTPSGGEHWFYRYIGPLRGSAGKLGAERDKDGKPIGSQIDVRADLGLCFLAPSHINGIGSYEWLTFPTGGRLSPLPRWVMNELGDKPEPIRSTYRPTNLHPDTDRANWRAEAVANTPDGQRNEKLYIHACKMFDHGHSLEEVMAMLLEPAVENGVIRAKARATIESASNPHNRRPVERRQRQTPRWS